MKPWLLAMLIAIPCLGSEWGQTGVSPPSGWGTDPWFSTFSIIAFDPATSELGVAVQSRAFAAGAAVPFAKPGVGQPLLRPQSDRAARAGIESGGGRQADH